MAISLTRRVNKSFTRILRSGIRRKLLCLALIFSLLILPSDLSLQQLPVMASTAIEFSASVTSWASSLWNWLFISDQPSRLTIADRIAQVSNVSVSPSKIVGYQGESILFNALPSNASGETVQGVRFSWESSGSEKLQIDNSGQATLISPGLVQVICQAGVVESRAWVLIREGQRPVQTDEQWDTDQNSLTDSGSVTGGTIGASTNFVDSLFETITPTALAQGSCNGAFGGDSSDFGYDELWSEPRNLTGSPRNRALESIRIGTVNPEGSNFNMSIPIYGLGGRGLGASLVLHYNSQVWSRHGSAVTFNATQGWPFAGFSLGFGRIFTYGSGSNTKYVWVGPDGTHRYLGTGSDTSSATYETNDGSHITFVGSKSGGGSLYFNDGTKVSITVTNNRLLPTRIRDSNGNYVAITYKTYSASTFPWRQAIDYVTDTLGRQLEFNYDICANLISIDVPQFGSGTNTIANFDYADIPISNSFSGLTVENRPTVNVPALKHIFFDATETGYKFDYSAYGMIYNVSMRKDMTYNSMTGAIGDGTEKSAVSFDYPTTASSLTDAPAFTEREETATNSPTSTFTYSSSTGTGTKTFTITRPDSSQLVLTRSTTSGTSDGLLIESQIKNSSSAIMAKNEIAYTTDGGGDPQVFSITNYDDAGTRTKVDYDYDSYGNVTNMREYGHRVLTAWKVRRRTEYVYKTDTAYINAYLRSLVVEHNIYDAQLNTSDGDDVLISKTKFTYDNYSAMGGMQTYTNMPAGHESAYDDTLTVRGNVTGTSQYYDIVKDEAITRLKKYDIFGSVVKEQLGCCNEREYVMVEGNGYATPVEVMSGAGSTVLATEMEDDFNTGLVTETTDPRGKETDFTFDAALRLDTVTSHTGASQEAIYDDSTLAASHTTNWTEGMTAKSATTSYDYDGWGRVIKMTAPNGAKTDTTYDAMGRVTDRSNPYTGTPPGVETEYIYDALGRTTIVELPDGDTVETSYNGITVEMTDQVNRKMKREVDGLGRLVKVYEQTSAGALTQETNYTYDLMDRLKEVDQGGQLRKYLYDDLGRLLNEKIPEQDGTWSCGYTYTDFNAVATKTDARGVVTTYSYDDLHRLTGISYNTSGASGVATTPAVTYVYDTTTSSATEGLMLSVRVGGLASAGGYEEIYGYDSENRVSSVSQKFNTGGSNTRTYTTSYEFTTAGQPTKMTYPSGLWFNIGHDSLGRLTSVSRPQQGNDPAVNYLSSASYNTAGLTTGWTIGSNIEESFGYDTDRLQMTSQTATQNGNTRLSLTYSYAASAGQMGSGSTAGNAGQLMSITGSIGGQTESASYTYDNLGRLVTSNQTSNGVSAARRFEYDRWGNRTGAWNATSGGTQIQSVDLEETSSIPTNRIESVTEGSTVNYTYDAAGNVTNDGVHSYTYDAENRLVSVDSGTTASYSYDHKNQRVKKVASSTTTHYIWQGSQVIAEHNGSTGAVITDYVFAGSRMVAREQSGSRVYFLYDRLSARATITDGVGGSIQGRQSHLPFGEELNATGTTDKHRFTSYERDSETGMDYAVNRGYSQSVGRFMQADPHRASSGAKIPQSWNRYSYVQNDPITFVDPTGLFAEVLVPVGVCDNSLLGQIYCLGTVPFPAPPIHVDEEVEEEEGEPPPCVQTPLPRNATGLYSITGSPQSNQYGRAGVIDVIVALGFLFRFALGQLGIRARIGIGDISLQGGGPFPPHTSHQRGLDVDIRPLRSDLAQLPVTWRDPNYSRVFTQLLVDLILSTFGNHVRVIFFNDPQIRGVTPFSGHDNHLHVSFRASSFPCP